jgi:hypothetical protein
LIIDALNELEKLGPKTWVVFDEVQSIGELDDNFWLEKTLRTKMQHSQKLTFIFSGSRRALIHPMFNDNTRAFFMSAQLIDFPRFGDEFTDWIISRFATIQVVVEPQVVTHLRKKVGDSPNFCQMVCFGLASLNEQNITSKMVDSVIRDLTHQNSYTYQTVLSSFSSVQQRVLRMVAIEETKVFSRDLLKQYDIKSPSHVSQAIKTAIKRQIIDESSSQGKIQFDDPFFATWLKGVFSDNVVY